MEMETISTDTCQIVHKPKQKRAKRNQVSAQQMEYAEYRAQGMSKREAAEKAGYKTTAGAYKADRNPIVLKYLSDAKRSAAMVSGYVVAIAMDEAKEGMIFAKETNNANAYCKAVELRAKLSGLLIDRVEVFTADLKGALLEASKRIINVTPHSPALEQMIEASLQAKSTTT